MDRRSLMLGAAITGTALAVPAIAKPSLPRGAESRFVSANGIRLHYVVAGTGPAVVLLHGWPQTWFGSPGAA